MKYHIHVAGEINEELFVSFSKKLSRLEKLPGFKINVLLSSEGGDAYTAFAFFDRIQASSKHITIIGIGQVSSAAMLILAAGDKRRMFRNAWALAHEDTTTANRNLQVSAVEKAAAHARRLEDRWSNLLSSVTKTSADKWNEIHKNETYLDAKECLALGLIDGIL